MKRQDRVAMLSTVLFALLLLLPSCKSSSVDPEPQTGYTYHVPEQAGDGWPTASAADVGMQTASFVTLMNDLSRQTAHNVHGIVVARNGKLVFEEYFSGEEMDIRGQTVLYVQKTFDRNTPHFLASASKSVTSLLIGIALDKGTLPGVDRTMFSFFPEYANLGTPQKNSITISHMLTMSSGIPWDEGYPFDDPRNDLVSMVGSQDPIGFVLAKQLTASPGVQFLYNSGTTNLLGEIVRRKSGQILNNFADQYLFAPLGIASHTWVGCAQKPDVALASSGLYITPREMAKIGQVCLQKGVWNGNRIVSENWVNESTLQHIQVPANQNPMPKLITGYGFQWWLGTFATGNSSVYFAAGLGGQYIFVFPSKDMVVVMTGGAYRTQAYEIFYDVVNNYILPSLAQ
jgi:CubicO group peptidase (beta-lactamase class C family)